MYKQSAFLKDDPQYIWNFIKKKPFATFVIKGSNLLATHIPVLSTGAPEKMVLFAHIAYNNEQIAFLKNDVEALVIFQGENAYVSSSWYEEADISTWDYSAVHVNGTIKLQTEIELLDSLIILVNHFEEVQEKPLYFSDIPKDIIKSHLPKIIGFWIYPSKVQAIAKMSQNKKEKDVESIISHLNKTCSHMDIQDQIRKENDRNN